MNAHHRFLVSSVAVLLLCSACAVSDSLRSESALEGFGSGSDELTRQLENAYAEPSYVDQVLSQFAVDPEALDRDFHPEAHTKARFAQQPAQEKVPAALTDNFEPKLTSTPVTALTDLPESQRFGEEGDEPTFREFQKSQIARLVLTFKRLVRTNAERLSESRLNLANAVTQRKDAEYQATELDNQTARLLTELSRLQRTIEELLLRMQKWAIRNLKLHADRVFNASQSNFTGNADDLKSIVEAQKTLKTWDWNLKTAFDYLEKTVGTVNERRKLRKYGTAPSQDELDALQLALSRIQTQEASNQEVTEYQGDKTVRLKTRLDWHEKSLNSFKKFAVDSADMLEKVKKLLVYNEGVLKSTPPEPAPADVDVHVKAHVVIGPDGKALQVSIDDSNKPPCVDSDRDGICDSFSGPRTVKIPDPTDPIYQDVSNQDLTTKPVPDAASPPTPPANMQFIKPVITKSDPVQQDQVDPNCTPNSKFYPACLTKSNATVKVDIDSNGLSTIDIVGPDGKADEFGNPASLLSAPNPPTQAPKQIKGSDYMADLGKDWDDLFDPLGNPIPQEYQGGASGGAKNPQNSKILSNLNQEEAIFKMKLKADLNPPPAPPADPSDASFLNPRQQLEIALKNGYVPPKENERPLLPQLADVQGTMQNYAVPAPPPSDPSLSAPVPVSGAEDTPVEKSAAHKQLTTMHEHNEAIKRFAQQQPAAPVAPKPDVREYAGSVEYQAPAAPPPPVTQPPADYQASVPVDDIPLAFTRVPSTLPTYRSIDLKFPPFAPLPVAPLPPAPSAVFPPPPPIPVGGPNGEADSTQAFNFTLPTPPPPPIAPLAPLVRPSGDQVTSQQAVQKKEEKPASTPAPAPTPAGSPAPAPAPTPASKAPAPAPTPAANAPAPEPTPKPVNPEDLKPANAAVIAQMLDQLKLLSSQASTPALRRALEKVRRLVGEAHIQHINELHNMLFNRPKGAPAPAKPKTEQAPKPESTPEPKPETLPLGKLREELDLLRKLFEAHAQKRSQGAGQETEYGGFFLNYDHSQPVPQGHGALRAAWESDVGKVDEGIDSGKVIPPPKGYSASEQTEEKPVVKSRLDANTVSPLFPPLIKPDDSQTPGPNKIALEEHTMVTGKKKFVQFIEGSGGSPPPAPGKPQPPSATLASNSLIPQTNVNGVNNVPYVDPLAAHSGPSSMAAPSAPTVTRFKSAPISALASSSKSAEDDDDDDDDSTFFIEVDVQTAEAPKNPPKAPQKRPSAPTKPLEKLLKSIHETEKKELEYASIIARQNLIEASQHDEAEYAAKISKNSQTYIPQALTQPEPIMNPLESGNGASLPAAIRIPQGVNTNPPATPTVPVSRFAAESDYVTPEYLDTQASLMPRFREVFPKAAGDNEDVSDDKLVDSVMSYAFASAEEDDEDQRPPKPDGPKKPKFAQVHNTQDPTPRSVPVVSEPQPRQHHRRQHHHRRSEPDYDLDDWDAFVMQQIHHFKAQDSKILPNKEEAKFEQALDLTMKKALATTELPKEALAKKAPSGPIEENAAARHDNDFPQKPKEVSVLKKANKMNRKPIRASKKLVDPRPLVDAVDHTQGFFKAQNIEPETDPVQVNEKLAAFSKLSDPDARPASCPEGVTCVNSKAKSKKNLVLAKLVGRGHVAARVLSQHDPYDLIENALASRRKPTQSSHESSESSSEESEESSSSSSEPNFNALPEGQDPYAVQKEKIKVAEKVPKLIFTLEQGENTQVQPSSTGEKTLFRS